MNRGAVGNDVHYILVHVILEILMSILLPDRCSLCLAYVLRLKSTVGMLARIPQSRRITYGDVTVAQMPLPNLVMPTDESTASLAHACNLDFLPNVGLHHDGLVLTTGEEVFEEGQGENKRDNRFQAPACPRGSASGEDREIYEIPYLLGN